jgi:imidazolonepropionase
MPRVSQLSIHGAAQVLRPPQARLPYLRHDRAGELSLEPGAIRVERGKIAGFAPDPAAPVQVDAGGGAVLPGLIDCRTHLPFAGWGPERPEASDAAVLRQSRELAAEMLQHGTTAFECRGDARALRLAARLAGGVEQAVVPTAAVPADELPQVVAETRARAAELPATDGRAARVHDLWLRSSEVDALRHGARAIDGLTDLRPSDVAMLVAAEAAAVLCPAAELLNAEHLAPARRLATAGAICAIASDCGPAETPVAGLPLVLGLAARLYGFDLREALLGCTLNAAWVLGLQSRKGTLEPGKDADLIVLDSPAEHLLVRFGRNPVAVVIVGGQVVHVRPDQAWRVTRSSR